MLNSFVAELKRRRVVRVALVYGAVAFAVVQAADVFVPALALPGWIITAMALLAVLGFPVALVLAWAYDIVPEGGVPPPGTAVPVARWATDRVGHRGRHPRPCVRSTGRSHPSGHGGGGGPILVS
jgi:hypothetical protein